MKRKEFLNSYWRYYLALEQEFIVSSSYVEIDENNFRTYSINFAKQLQAIGAELDNFFKVFCNLPEKSKIYDYAKAIIGESGSYINIVNQGVIVEGYDIAPLIPFCNWQLDKPPDWWFAFNKIKHNRVAEMKSASHENVLNALAALYLLEMKHLSNIALDNNEIDVPDIPSILFELKDWQYKNISLRNATISISGTS